VLLQNTYFRNFEIASGDDNVITLEVTTENLVKAFRTCSNGGGNGGAGGVQSVDYSRVKLIRSGLQPFLIFQTVTIDGANIVQEVPVKVHRGADGQRLREPPPVDPPTVRMFVPSARSLQAAVERMKSVHKQVLLRAALGPGGGEILLESASDTVVIKTHFRCHQTLPQQPTAPGGAGGAGSEVPDLAPAPVDRVTTAHAVLPARVLHRLMKAAVNTELPLLVGILPFRYFFLHVATGDRTSSHTFLLGLIDTGTGFAVAEDEPQSAELKAIPADEPNGQPAAL
jgi:hypothetical protein